MSKNKKVGGKVFSSRSPVVSSSVPVVKSKSSAMPKVTVVDMKFLESKSPDIRYIDSYMRYWKQVIRKYKVDPSVPLELIHRMQSFYTLGCERMSAPISGPVVGGVDVER